MRVMLLVILALAVYPVHNGDVEVCGDGLRGGEAVCLKLDGFNRCTFSDHAGQFCISTHRPMMAGETFPVWATYSGETVVRVLYVQYIPFVSR